VHQLFFLPPVSLYPAGKVTQVADMPMAAALLEATFNQRFGAAPLASDIHPRYSRV
jgi:hypothetical protein